LGTFKDEKEEDSELHNAEDERREDLLGFYIWSKYWGDDCETPLAESQKNGL
jgi:hypothetical protein